MSRASITQAIHGKVVATFVLSLLCQMSWSRVNRLDTALKKQLVSKGSFQLQAIMSPPPKGCPGLQLWEGSECLSWGWLDRLQGFSLAWDAVIFTLELDMRSRVVSDGGYKKKYLYGVI